MESSASIVIDVVPAQREEVADAEGSAGSEHNQYIIAELAACAEVLCHVVELLLVSDWFCGCHFFLAPFSVICLVCYISRERDSLTFSN